MKIRTIMTAAAAGILLTIAGSSLAFGADWVCPRGYADCQNYEYCTTHDHGDCDGQWDGEGNWVCPDGAHSYCHSASAGGSQSSKSTGPSASRPSSASGTPSGTRPSSGTRGQGHHGSGCGSHHR